MVRTGRTGGPDVAPFVAAVTALARVHVQRDVAAAVLGRGGCVEMIADRLFFLSGQITGGMLVFFISPQGVARCVGDLGMARLVRLDANVSGRVSDVANERFTYLAIRDVGGGCKVLKGILGDVMLVSENTF